MPLIHSMSWRQTLLKGMLYVVASFGFAVYLNVATNVWRLIELLPAAVVSGTAKFLLLIFAPIQPSDVHEQEELLELLLVWFFSAPATVCAIVAAHFFVRRISKRRRG